MSGQVALLEELIEQFQSFPGIGRKTAQRLAFHLLSLPKEQAERFAHTILEAKEKIHRCEVCQNLTEGELCSICADPSRDASTICVVEDPQDVIAFERTEEYRGRYHVLHGLISPLDGVGPDDIFIKELVLRMSAGEVQEVIMATNPTVAGEATAMYISKLLKPLGVKVSRLAYGIPVGGSLEFADEITLYRALEGRREL